MLWLLIVGAICCLYVYLYLIKYSDNPGNIPVYPGRIPLLGNVSFLLGDTIEFWDKIKKVNEYAFHHGNVIVFYIATIPIYVITDPDDCNTVLSNCMHKPWIMKNYLRQFLGNGLLIASVSVWKEHRKLMNPSFNPQVLDSFMDIFNAQSRRLVESWKDLVNKGAFDHHIHLEKNALETICLTAAGIDISHQNDFNEKCLLAFRTVISTVIQRTRNPFYYFDKIYNMSALKKTEDFHVKTTHELTNRVLKRNRQENETHAERGIVNINSACTRRTTVRLLDLSNSVLSDKDIQDEMNNIILTGFETSSTAICYTLLLLGTYPNIQEKCYEEIREIFGDSYRDVDKEDLPRLKYLEAVLKETLRLCPIVPLTLRAITDDIQLSKVYAFMTMKVTLVHILRHYQITGNYNNMKLKNNGINKPAYGHEISLELRQ